MVEQRRRPKNGAWDGWETNTTHINMAIKLGNVMPSRHPRYFLDVGARTQNVCWTPSGALWQTRRGFRRKDWTYIKVGCVWKIGHMINPIINYNYPKLGFIKNTLFMNLFEIQIVMIIIVPMNIAISSGATQPLRISRITSCLWLAEIRRPWSFWGTGRKGRAGGLHYMLHPFPLFVYHPNEIMVECVGAMFFLFQG